MILRPHVVLSTILFLSLPVAFAQSPTAKIVSSANAFLASLDPEKRSAVSYAFTDEEQRARWSNFPTSFVRRGGIKLGDMTEPQRTAALALVSAALSKRGYEEVLQIMDGDEVLKTTEGNGPPNAGGDAKGKGKGKGKGGPGGGGPNFGKDLYYISILGTPSETRQWMLQFGGHHLALNITIEGAKGILTPSLIGAQPAYYTLNGKTVRPMAGESDKALALVNALDETQRKQAILNYQVRDLVLGPGQDGKTIQPEGMKVSAMNAKQKALLLDLIGVWTGIVHDSAAAARMKDLQADLNETWFAWSGSTTPATGGNISAYYRVQGPRLVIEYSPQSMGGDASLHIHAMYRDPTYDYGRKPTAK